MSGLFFSTTAIYIAVYSAAAVFLCRGLPQTAFRSYAFAFLNILFAYILFFSSNEEGTVAFGLSFLAVAAIWVLIEKGGRSEQPYWLLLAFFAPLIWLCVSKSAGILTIVGLSYLSFRVAHLVWVTQAETSSQCAF